MPGQESSLLMIMNAPMGISDTVYHQIFSTSALEPSPLSVEKGAAVIENLSGFHPPWLFLYLLVLFGLLAWVRVYYGNILSQTVQASTNFQMAARMFKDKSMLQIQLDNILHAFYFLAVACFLFFMEERLELAPYGLHGMVLYLFNLSLMLGIFLARIVLINLLGWLFNQLELFREYLYQTFIFNKLLGLVLLPVLLVAIYTRGAFQEVIIWVALGTVATVIIMRIIRGVVYSFKKDISIFYMFLYLCALEIAPLALMYRWLVGVL
jgi:ABC-type multidrug transport system fused ATPase/permease subunit